MEDALSLPHYIQRACARPIWYDIRRTPAREHPRRLEAPSMPLSRRAFLQLSSAAAFAPNWARLVPATDPATVAFCRKLASDPLRPQYHLLPAHNWMNDPNGPIFFKGRYHMFHQYNPQAAVWGNMNWAHATSSDMIHWEHEPIALSPTPGGPDCDGVFSGSAVLDKGTPTVIYTGVAPPTSDSDATLRDAVPQQPNAATARLDTICLVRSEAGRRVPLSGGGSG